MSIFLKYRFITTGLGRLLQTLLNITRCYCICRNNNNTTGEKSYTFITRVTVICTYMANNSAIAKGKQACYIVGCNNYILWFFIFFNFLMHIEAVFISKTGTEKSFQSHSWTSGLRVFEMKCSISSSEPKRKNEDYPDPCLLVISTIVTK